MLMFACLFGFLVQLIPVDGAEVVKLGDPSASCNALVRGGEQITSGPFLEGSTCVTYDDDQDSCNDCLSLNCTLVIESVFSIPFRIPFRNVILPCYDEYNGSNIHAVNSIVYHYLQADKVWSNVTVTGHDEDIVSFDFGLTSGNLTIIRDVIQNDTGITFAVRVRNNPAIFSVLNPVYIPIACVYVNDTECAVMTTVQPFVQMELQPGEIVGIVVGAILFSVVVVSLVILVMICIKKQRRKRKRVKWFNKKSIAMSPEKSFGVVNSKFENMLMREEVTSYQQAEDNPYLTFDLKYGLSTPSVEFSNYNKTRLETEKDIWEFPRENLIYMRELGRCAFGKVLLMKAKDIAGYEGTIPVVAKTLQSDDPDDQRKFEEETELMKKFSHKNIISLLGTCGKVLDGAPMIIQELMPYGDLQGFLENIRESGGNEISSSLMCQMALDVLAGLEFLAENNYVHRDIAARNCMVGDELIVKISDFGLTRAIHNTEFYKIQRPAQFQFRWLAPECILYGIFTLKSDIWSFGVLLYEIITLAGTPYEDLDCDHVVAAIQNKNLFLEKPSDCPKEEMYTAIRRCQTYDPDDRPSYDEIRSYLSMR